MFHLQKWHQFHSLSNWKHNTTTGRFLTPPHNKSPTLSHYTSPTSAPLEPRWQDQSLSSTTPSSSTECCRAADLHWRRYVPNSCCQHPWWPTTWPWPANARSNLPATAVVTLNNCRRTQQCSVRHGRKQIQVSVKTWNHTVCWTYLIDLDITYVIHIFAILIISNLLLRCVISVYYMKCL